MILTAESLSRKSAREVRALTRDGEWTAPTSGLALGYAQANMIVLPQDWAYDFLLYATRNPKPCPILDVTEAGDPEPKLIAPGADVRTDLPRYRIWKNGELVDEPTDIKSAWRSDLVAFMIGCSFSFESALLDAGVPVRHIEENVNVPMYLTDVQCIPAGRFSGNMVMSMRPIPHHQVVKAVTCTARFPSVHGAPLHIGDPSAIGVKDINRPEFGDPVTINSGEVPVFWACGVTPQAAVMRSKPPFAITHAPGHMFIADKRDSDYEVF
ncbi:MAG: putative hydro-lyase [Synergistaceae bacterium]|jgi:uncharacterized protein YcsI (UPF0317 family)|nr:putative hydro-lyase [Synergistaceae bacterium]